MDFDAPDGDLSLPLPRAGLSWPVAGDARAIRGFWIQPAAAMQDREDPGGRGQSFASPLLLARAGDDAGSATWSPLQEGFTLYLKIYRDAEGKLVGAFRNPQYNSNGGASLYEVQRDGERVPFGASARRAIRRDAIFEAGRERLRMTWPETGRISRSNGARRRSCRISLRDRPTPRATPIARRPAPVTVGHGACRGGRNMDEDASLRSCRTLIDADPAARRAPLVHALLVARHGKLVLEEYFHGYERERRTTCARPARPSPR